MIANIRCGHDCLQTSCMCVCVSSHRTIESIYRHVMHISFFFPMSFAPFWILHCSEMLATFLPRPLFLLCFAKNKSLCTILHSLKLTASPKIHQNPKGKAKVCKSQYFREAFWLVSGSVNDTRFWQDGRLYQL